MSEQMVESNQIPHAGEADDSGLQKLAEEAREADAQITDAVDWDGQRIREEAVKISLQTGKHSSIAELIENAATIEAFILKGYSKPEHRGEEAQPVVGSRAFVDAEDGTFKEV